MRSSEEELPVTERSMARLKAYLDGSITLPPSIHAHTRQRQVELAVSLAGRVPVYLDSRFWIDLWGADEDCETSRAHSLLMALRAGVSDGRLFCSISASTFIKMMKHADAEVRRRTAALVDELSLGVAVLALDELLEAEVRSSSINFTDAPLDPTLEPVWTRLAYGSHLLPVPPTPALLSG